MLEDYWKRKTGIYCKKKIKYDKENPQNIMERQLRKKGVKDKFKDSRNEMETVMKAKFKKKKNKVGVYIFVQGKQILNFERKVILGLNEIDSDTKSKM